MVRNKMRKLIFFAAIFFSMVATAQIPFKADALVLLDGTVRIEGTDTFFADKSGNGRNFKITNCDFDYSNQTKGWPYKSLATIAAPPNDPVLIAANSDSFFYRNGVPVQLPVTAFFQDINYNHRIFSLHTDQVLDGQEHEAYTPRVKEIVFYNSARSGTDSLKCLGYFRVPAEDLSALWLSEQGNNSNPGTKNSPKQSFGGAGVGNTTAATIYVKSGRYDFNASTVSWSGATPLTVQALGDVSFWLGYGSTGFTVSRPVTINNCRIKDSAATSGIRFNSQLSFNSCHFTKTKGLYLTLCGIAAQQISFNNCVFNAIIPGSSTTICTNTVAAPGRYIFTGNYGDIKHVFKSSATGGTVIFKWNKGNKPEQNIFYDSTFYFKNNTGIGNLTVNNLKSKLRIENEYIDFNVLFSDSTTLSNTTVFGNVSGKYDTIINCDITGAINVTAKVNALYKGIRAVTTTEDQSTLFISAVANANITGVVIDSCVLTGNQVTNYILYCGETNQQGGVNAIYAPVISRNKIVNTSLDTANQAHTVFIGGGNNPSFFYNDVSTGNGYFMVIKNGGNHYSSPDPNVYYNIFRNTGRNKKGIYVRGAYGVTIANNTFLNFKCEGYLFESDDNAQGMDNSLLAINNVINQGGTVLGGISTGANTTSRNNVVNKNGFLMSLPATDSSTTITIDTITGVPAAPLNFGEVTSKTSGLDPIYSIPGAVITKEQMMPFQRGAVIK